MIDTRTHGVIDYLTGALLMIAPYLFGFATGGIEQWLPQLLGAMIVVMSLFTAYELSFAKIIPLKLHLGVDIVSGILLAISPWLFGFADIIWTPPETSIHKNQVYSSQALRSIEHRNL